MTCKLLSCKGDVTPETGRVEVRAFQVQPEHRRALKVDWNDNGEAIFHPKCWTSLTNAVSHNASSDIDVSETEERLIEEATKTAEFHDPESFVTSEAKRIVKMIREAEYCITFTGAGISTAAGIGDFRGKDGKWTERDKLKDHGSKGAKKTTARKGYSIMALRPTYTHEAIVKLLEIGRLKYVISQNTDGLHRLSGVPEEKISELHGNAFVDKCEQCKVRTMRSLSHRAMSQEMRAKVPEKKCDRCRINHRTGRICDKKGCGGYCMNTIINFGDYLETPVLRSAEDNAKKADVVLCLGSTLMVSPANSLVEMGEAEQPTRLVICNRQGTPYDHVCLKPDKEGVPMGSRIHGDCDQLMRAVMLEILGAEKHREWEGQREARIAQYDSLRDS